MERKQTCFCNKDNSFVLLFNWPRPSVFGKGLVIRFGKLNSLNFHLLCTTSFCSVGCYLRGGPNLRNTKISACSNSQIQATCYVWYMVTSDPLSRSYNVTNVLLKCFYTVWSSIGFLLLYDLVEESGAGAGGPKSYKISHPWIKRFWFLHI